eukprot:3703775-Rhodomonas_salina.3
MRDNCACPGHSHERSPPREVRTYDSTVLDGANLKARSGPQLTCGRTGSSSCWCRWPGTSATTTGASTTAQAGPRQSRACPTSTSSVCTTLRLRSRSQRSSNASAPRSRAPLASRSRCTARF